MFQTVSDLGNRLDSCALRYRGLLARQTSVRPSTRRAALWRASPKLDDTSAVGRLERLEAVLFLAKEPLSTRKLAQLATLADGTEARTLLKRLNKAYDVRGRSFRVEEIAGGYQLLTRPKFAPWLRRMVGAPSEIRLSGPASETLAVVAYRQPVLRAEIEAIRGVQCGEVLRQLMERGLVRIAGRSDELGRPFLYGTTRNFLQLFGLRNLDELPRASMLRKSDDDSTGDPTSHHQAGSELSANAGGQQDQDKEAIVTAATIMETTEEVLEIEAEKTAAGAKNQAEDDFDDLDDDDDYDDDDDDDDDEDDDFDEDDDDFADDDWEEVEDDLDDDDDEWDDDDDEDWGDDDDDWDDDEED